MFFHVLVCSALIHFLYIISVPLCCFFYLFILFFLAISYYFSSNFLFLFAKKKRKKIKEKCINFAKKIMFWLVLLSFIFFCIFLSLFVVHFHFFFEKRTSLVEVPLANLSFMLFSFFICFSCYFMLLFLISCFFSQKIT